MKIFNQNKLLTFFFLAIIFIEVSAYIFYSQYSAVLYPFADHLDTYSIIDEMLSKNLYENFFRFHNEHLPLLSRSFFVFNAYVANYNIRNEYFFANLVMVGLYISIVIFFYKYLTLEAINLAALSTFASIIVFNPAASSYWWWSYMVETPLAIFFALLAFIGVTTKRHYITISILCICAIFSQALGIFVAPTIFLYYLFLGNHRKIKLYWLLFSAISCGIYLIYAPRSSNLHESFSGLLIYLPIFIGKSLKSIFYNDYLSMWGRSSHYLLSFLIGALSIFGALLLLYKACFKYTLQDKYISLSFFLILFPLIIGSVTWWGRAGMAGEGFLHANSQPTFLISGLFYIGFSVLLFRTIGQRGKDFLILFICLCCLFSPFVLIRSYPIYKEAHEFNAHLQEIYQSKSIPESDVSISVDREEAKNMLNKFCKRSIDC